MALSKLIGREGGEFVANTITAGDQTEPKVAKLASGGFVVTWVDLSGIDTSGRGIIGQLFDSAGAKVGGEFLVNTTTAGDQDTPSVAALASGGFVVSWSDTSTGSVALKAQIFDSAGAKSGGEFPLNIGSGTQILPQLAALPGGGFVTVTYRGIGQAFDAAGNKAGAEFVIGGGSAFTSGATVAPLASGGFVVEAFQTNTRTVVLQLFDSTGAKTGAELALSPGSDFQDQVSAAGLTSGGFVLTWRTTTGTDVRGQLFDATGNVAGSEFRVNTTTQGNQSQPSVAAMPNGGFLVTWADTSSVTPVTQSNIRGQLFDGAGAKVGSEFTVSTLTDSVNSNHDQPSVALLDSGRFVVAWHGAGPGDTRTAGTTDGGIRTQIFASLTSATLDVTASATTVGETVPDNVAALKLATASPAINGSYTYALISDSTGGAFRLDGDRLVVADNRLLDFETASTASLTIRSTDQAGDTIDKVIQLNIADAAIENRYTAGLETRVNGTTDFTQTGAAIAHLASGGFVVTWTDGSFRADGTGTGIKAQIFDSVGHASGSEFLVNTLGNAVQQNPGVASLPGGGFVISWMSDAGDSSAPGIDAQIFDAAGQKVGGEIHVNTTTAGVQQDTHVAALAGGGFVVSWEDDSGTAGDVSGAAVRLQIFDASGTKVGAELLANTTTAGSQNQAVVAGLAGGGFVTIWTDASLQGGDASGTSVKAQLFGTSGAKIGTEFLVNTSTAFNQNTATVEALPSGGFVAAWADQSRVGGDTSGSAIKAQLFAADGSRVGSEFLVNTTTLGTQFQPSVTLLSSGGFAISWTDNGATGVDGESTAVRAQLFDLSGARVGAEFLVNDVTARDQSQSKLAGLAGGGLAAVWLDGSRGISFFTDVKLRLFTRTDLPVAHNDAFTTDEAHAVSGSLFADNGLGVDVGASHVLSVNGSATAVGQQIVLASGALLTVNADGTFSYDPNGAFNYLVPPGGGASDVTASDSFTYTIDGGATATATVTVNGLASAGDEYRGTSGADPISGTGAADHMLGGAGNDIYIVNDLGDVVTENPGEGVDEVRTSLSSYVLAANVENLTGIGSGFQTLRGNSGDNVITAGAGGGFLRLEDGGNDTAKGLGGNDVFLFGATMTSADKVDGGTGRDQIAIQGDYWTAPLTLGANVVNTESLAILPGSDTRFGDPGTNSYDYNVTMVDANVAAGVQFIVDANRLRAGEDFTFDGSAERDGSFFIYGGGGTDNLTGGLGNDAFYFGEGGQFGASDHVDGGPGGTDQLGLRGNYTIVFGATQLVGIENIGMVSALDTRFGPLGNNNNYDLTMNDGNVVAGQQMTVDAAALRSTETLTFNGSAERDGSFRIFGGAGNDRITGSLGNDILVGGRGADMLDGGAGADIFRYRSAAESSSTHFD
ncbi:MAG: hypothetical protein QOH81_1414, partial [Sphingomonadales bacterium]|nr:hypothetical protein [Sphingomonadales bacterium]